MKGHVQRRGKTYRYFFDGDPDPLTDKRRQVTKGGFATEREAWTACREAMADHEQGRLVRQNRRTVEQLIEEWLSRRQHSVKRSMHSNYQNYSRYYVYPYIGHRRAQDLDSAVFDTLYAKLLTSGRVKANAEHHRQRAAQKAAREQAIAERAKGKRRRGPAPKPRPVTPEPQPGLAPKTVVNVHRMLHRVWEDAARWGYVRRNIVADASPPRVPRKIRRTWTVAQLTTFLLARSSPRSVLRTMGSGSDDRNAA